MTFQRKLNTEELARRLNQARQDQGFTYAALGRSAGVDASQSFRICRGAFRNYLA